MMPALGAVAVVSAQWVCALKRGRGVLLGAMVLVGLGQYWLNFVGLSRLPNEVRIPLPFKIYPPEEGWKNSLRAYAQDFYSTHPPRREDWQIEAILSKLLATKPPIKAHIKLSVRRNDFRFAGGMFEYVVLRDRLPVAFTGASESDYIVDRVGAGEPASQEIEGLGHRLLWDVPLPDGSRAVVYRSRLFNE